MLKPGVYRKGELNVADAVAQLMKELPRDSGALVTFIGVVKEVGMDGKTVTAVEMEAYDEYADVAIQKICGELKKKYDLGLAVIYHFVGSFDVSEPLIFIAVSAKSRFQAFPALREAVERYKTEPAIWKKEVYIDGSHAWISGD